MKLKFNYLRVILLVMIFALIPVLAVSQTNLTVVYSNATTREYTIESSGKLYFSGTNLMIQTDASTTAESIAVSDIRKLIFGNSSGIDATAIMSQFVVYPNPATNTIYFTHTDKGDVFSVRIFDLQGREIQNGMYKSEEMIDISQLSSGVYFVRFNNLETVKLLKK